MAGLRAHKTIPKTNERPPGPRPKCRNCSKPLASYWVLEWPGNSANPVSQTFSGYGRLGNGYFCSRACGYHFAVRVLNSSSAHTQ